MRGCGGDFGCRIRALAVCALWLGVMVMTACSQEPPPPPPASAQDIAVAESLSRVFRRVAGTLSPAVVHIETTREVEMQGFPGLPQDLFGDDFLRRFFGPEVPRKFRQQGLGSGVIVDPEGYIVTNNHVVEGAAKIQVKVLGEGTTEHDATLVGTDPDTDLALIKINAEKLKAASFGDSSKVQVGDWVVAIGNPFGLDHTVTTGIVSATGRRIGLATYENLIQTDAAINPGNSGGPLANIQGEVIGINAAITSPSGAFAGIGLSIPSNTAKKVVATLKEKGKVSRGFLGVTLQALTPDLAKSFGPEVAEGILISEVQPGSPAAKANLKPGDIIVRVEGRPVKTLEQLQELVAAQAPGAKVALEIVRNGKPQTLGVVLAERQGAAAAQPPATPTNFLGIVVQDLTPDLAARLGYRQETGVFVAEVEAGSPAEAVGIKPGDLIEEVDGKPARSVAEYNAAVQAALGKPAVAFRVREGKYVRYVAIKTR